MTTTTNTQLTTICNELILYKSTDSMLEVLNLLVLFRSTDSMLELLNLDESRFSEVSAILHQFGKEWERVECAPEGPTQEQDAELDRIIVEYAEELLNFRAKNI